MRMCMSACAHECVRVCVYTNAHIPLDCNEVRLPVSSASISAAYVGPRAYKCLRVFDGGVSKNRSKKRAIDVENLDTKFF